MRIGDIVCVCVFVLAATTTGFASAIEEIESIQGDIVTVRYNGWTAAKVERIAIVRDGVGASLTFEKEGVLADVYLTEAMKTELDDNGIVYGPRPAKPAKEEANGAIWFFLLLSLLGQAILAIALIDRVIAVRDLRARLSQAVGNVKFLRKTGDVE